MQRIYFRRLIAVAAVMLAVVFVFSAVVFSDAFYARDGEADRALNNAIAYCEGHDFDTTLTGKVTARVFGIPYTQKAFGSRQVRDGGVVDKVESSSAFVKAAVRKTYSGGKYFVEKGEFKSGGVEYGERKTFTAAEYIENYGKPAIGLSKYELTSSVTSSQKVGENVYEYALDPLRAAVYTRNEVKAALESKSYPEYEYITLTLTTDGERPVSVTVREKFRVDKFGGAKVATEYTETFGFSE